MKKKPRANFQTIQKQNHHTKKLIVGKQTHTLTDRHTDSLRNTHSQSETYTHTLTHTHSHTHLHSDSESQNRASMKSSK